MNLNLILRCVRGSARPGFRINGAASLSTFCRCPSLYQNGTALTSKRSVQIGAVRLCSGESNDNKNDVSTKAKLPPLMNFPEVVWPSLIKSLRNFILAHFIIKPYFDKDFNLPDFVSGAKQAVEVVSNQLSNGDVKTLNGLVDGDIIPKLQASLSLMSLTQREQIAINKEDIYFSFPYQVGVIFNEEEGKPQKRYVEVTMVYHTLRGLAQMRERGEEPPINMGMIPEYQQKISICNYRFVREYTKGVDSDWTVNLLNHFRPVEQLN